MDFAMLCVLQAINSLVGWYEESNASDAIKALTENLAPERNVKRSGEWLNKAPMDCCVKSGEVELGVRVTGKDTELVKIISAIANTNHVGHFEIIIYPNFPRFSSLRLLSSFVHHGVSSTTLKGC